MTLEYYTFLVEENSGSKNYKNEKKWGKNIWVQEKVVGKNPDYKRIWCHKNVGIRNVFGLTKANHVNVVYVDGATLPYQRFVCYSVWGKK